MHSALNLARDVAARLGEVPGVAAVALGGSWARGEERPDSDVDLGIYYRPESPPDIADLRRLAREIDDRHLPDLATGIGAWGPWINGGGWLRVGGRPVDWLYCDTDKVEAVFDRCTGGVTACHYQPGHPHGFHEHIYLGEVHHCRTLHDPEGLLRGLKSAVATYPPRLKRAIIDRYLWEAGFCLRTARKPAARGESYYVSGCLFRGVSCLVQALFALNERYFVNEKGSVRAAGSFAARPEAFEQAVSGLLGSPGRDAQTLTGSLSRYESLLEEVATCCDGAKRGPESSGPLSAS